MGNSPRVGDFDQKERNAILNQETGGNLVDKNKGNNKIKTNDNFKTTDKLIKK
jgi:hypothetical protein